MRYEGPDGDIGWGPCIEANLADGVLTVTLNRPQERNRMNVEIALGMEALLQSVAIDPDVRVVILRGAGPGFSAGMDLEDFSDVAAHGERKLRAAKDSALHWPVRLLGQIPQPVIAVVHGFCHGEAIDVLEGCDIVLVADDCEFSLPQAAEARFLAGPTCKSISRMMAPRPANYYALTGYAFTGIEAERSGLASRSLAPGALEQEAQALAREFVAKDAIAVQFTKEALQYVDSMSWDGVLNFTAAKLAQLKSLQAGRPSTRAAAVESFLAGKSKPGLGG